MTESWAKRIAAITLFVEDLAVAREFYQRAFELPVHFEDDSSIVFAFGGTLINLLDAREAPELIAPANPGDRDVGPRSQLTLQVADVDAVCAELLARGVELLNGPMDRPWHIRTASFRDPAGHVWKLAQ